MRPVHPRSRRSGALSRCCPYESRTISLGAEHASRELTRLDPAHGCDLHPQLEIIINGEQVPAPSNIGDDNSTGAMSAVHTHEADGTIHIEAGVTGELFTLGQLFTQWGVKLTTTQIGGVKADQGEKVTVISNGSAVAGDPMDLRLEPEQKIVVQLP